jgi:lipopolysaccharide/colanic/teichoic acid biosynthesis glycosyltransferase
VKRALDLSLGFVALVACAPVIGLAALAIRMRDRTASPFFGHEREGLDGRVFQLWKLRTMVADGDALLEERLATDAVALAEWRRYFRLADDPRLLGGLGRSLRRFSVDELPQLWNVLLGQMSLVGPRPLPAFVLAELPADFVARRREVKPGMTGLWQVSGRSDLDLDGLCELDARYLASASLRADLAILLRTPFAVARASGAY